MLIAEHVITSSSAIAMAYATMVAENWHTVLRQPLDALKIRTYRTFTPAELVGVQAAAYILTHVIMPIVRMTRQAAWPALCDTLAEWMVQFERTRAGVLRMERYWKGRAGDSTGVYTKRLC